jgi:hypothetical protein
MRKPDGKVRSDHVTGAVIPLDGRRLPSWLPRNFCFNYVAGRAIIPPSQS